MFPARCQQGFRGNMSAWVDYKYEAVLVRVHDGDTIFVTVDLGFRLNVVSMPIRLYGINAPELSTDAGKAALAYIETLIAPGDALLIQTYKDPLDKFGRWLADVYKGTLWISRTMRASGTA